MRRRSSLVLVTGAVALVALVSACSSSTKAANSSSAAGGSSSAASTSGGGGGGSIKLAFLPSFQDPYFVQEAKGAQDEAKKLGVDLVVQNANGSDSTAVNNLQTLITTGGVKGVLIAVPDQQIGTTVVNTARKAKLPLVATDNQLPGAPFVGFKWADIGTQAGMTAAQLFTSAKWDASTTTAVSVELQTLQTCNDRTSAQTTAFLAGAPGFPKDNVVHLPYDGSQSKALTAMSTVKTAHPATKHWVVWSCNDDGIVGAIQALTSAGVPAANIIGVGLNGNLACPQWKAGKTQSYRQAVFTDPARTGALGIQELYANITTGKAIPDSNTIGGVPVNPSNYQQLMRGYINC